MPACVTCLWCPEGCLIFPFESVWAQICLWNYACLCSPTRHVLDFCLVFKQDDTTAEKLASASESRAESQTHCFRSVPTETETEHLMKLWFNWGELPTVKISVWKQTAAVGLLSAETLCVCVCVGMDLVTQGAQILNHTRAHTHTHTHTLLAAFVLIYIDPWLCGGPVIKLTHQRRNWWLHQTTTVCVWDKESAHLRSLLPHT